MFVVTKDKLLTGSWDESRRFLLKKRVFLNKILGRFSAVFGDKTGCLTRSSDTFQPKHWVVLTERIQRIFSHVGGEKECVF